MTVAASRISRLGHIGLRCLDVDSMREFYSAALGFQVTDSEPERDLYFMSPAPELDHHMLVLTHGRTQPLGDGQIQQVSWRCETLEDLLGHYERLVAYGANFEKVVSHGNAIGVYFFDPDGNRTEVYWPTGIQARQPFSYPIELDGGSDAVLNRVRETVEHHRESGQPGG